ncbi:MAG: LuxR C-terminal-related transcriptional regulator [Akkermansiaceae bacterium]
MLSSQETEQLHALWRVAADTKLTDTRASLRQFTEALAKLLNAKNVMWLAAIYGKAPSDVFSSQLFNGWWCLDVIDFDETVDQALAMSTYMTLVKEYGPGEDTISMVKKSGKTRVQLRQDILTDDEHDEFWKTNLFHIPIRGIKERIHTAYSVSPTAESYLVIDRAPDQKKFTEHERTLAYLAIAGAANLHKNLLLERGLISPAVSPLSPREKETFPLLFTEMTQKEIASELKVTLSTARQYINSVYRKFNVNGRSGLISCAI